MRAGWIAPLALLAIGVVARDADAQSANGPRLMPSRDVTVLYKVQAEGAPQAQPVKVYFGGGGSLLRIDGPDGPDGDSRGAMILDRTGKVMTVVLHEPKVYMQIPEKEEVRTPFVLDPSMKFTRAGTATVAGLACTQWTITSPKGNATACVTDDGVVLSEAGVDGAGSRGQLTAQKVSYETEPATLFAPPAGYQRTTQPPNLGQGMGPGPGAGGPTVSGPTPGSAATPGMP